jgi:hypothetical protein
MQTTTTRLLPLRGLCLSSFLFLFIVSCSSPTPTLVPATETPLIPTATLPPTETPLPTDTPTPIGTPEPALARPQYAINLQMDYARMAATVNQTITYPNWTGETLSSLVLAVEPTCSRSFTLNSIAVDGQPVTNYVFDKENPQAFIRHRLEVPLPQPLQPSGIVTLSISYGLFLPQIGNYGDETDLCSQIYGYSSQQVNLVDWYPFVVPYISGKWVLHNPWYYGEHLTYDASDYDVSVTFVDGATPVIASSGEEVESEAATSRRFKIEAARSFALSFSTVYNIATMKVGDVTLYSYYFASYSVQGEAVLKDSALAMQIYSDRFGAYPHKTLSIVQGDFDDGMEYSALYYHSKGIYNTYQGDYNNHFTAVSVHETAHQWWFDQVGNDQGFEPWLDESLATYSEIIFYETVSPDALRDWWWTYRFDPYKPENRVDTRIYEGEGQRPYWNKVYLNGAHFLQDLRARVGDEIFFAFIRDYLAQNKGKIVTSADFFRIFREHTATDISDLIAQYFQGTY